VQELVVEPARVAQVQVRALLDPAVEIRQDPGVRLGALAVQLAAPAIQAAPAVQLAAPETQTVPAVRAVRLIADFLVMEDLITMALPGSVQIPHQDGQANRYLLKPS
jgi:hypothetical protein